MSPMRGDERARACGMVGGGAVYVFAVCRYGLQVGEWGYRHARALCPGDPMSIREPECYTLRCAVDVVNVEYTQVRAGRRQARVV